MKSLWVEESSQYDGGQLRSLFGYLEHGILGDSIVSWRGACDIPPEKMVDGEDLLEHAKIEGSDMIHFIIEAFDKSLAAGVGFQRLFATIVRDVICEMNSDWTGKLKRDGDDLYFEDRKLSISIATKSPISCLIHFAVNVSFEGTPVPTIGLRDLDIDPTLFAEKVMGVWTKEYTEICQATQKVRSVN